MSDVAINQVLSQMRTMASAASREATGAAEGAQPGEFGQLMSRSISEVNESMQASKAMQVRFESGDPNVSIAEVMVTAQKASLQFAGLTEVRNKLLTAYQEVMNMQV